ncbi:hypothetical protein D3C77_784220 [compost metagenome]
MALYMTSSRCTFWISASCSASMLPRSRMPSAAVMMLTVVHDTPLVTNLRLYGACSPARPSYISLRICSRRMLPGKVWPLYR